MPIEIKTFKRRTNILFIMLNCKKDICSDKKIRKAIITNDGWWSESQGYKQHLSYAKIRSIETRRSIARSANTGSSAIINKKGEKWN